MGTPRILSQLNSFTAPRTLIIEDNDDGAKDGAAPKEPDDSYLGLYASLSAIRQSNTKYLNYTTDYVSHWQCKEAFRESYQNWRDGILRSAKLDPSQFKTIYIEENRLILVQVREPNTEKLLGFIRLEYDEDGLAVGGLKMANFNASLEYDVLGTGGTSKANDPRQTGQHGEGMKLSALVYRRNNYNFRIESSGFKWNFIFKKGELVCHLNRFSEAALATMKTKSEAQGPSRLPISHPWEDVCVVIGAPGQARTISGRKVPGARVHVDDFKTWLKVTLDINPPTKIINTSKGDLIRDPTYRSHMYLRGLLLPSGGMSGKEYGYGYNFTDGSTGRDRHSLAGSGEESKRIASIWAAAIRADNLEDSDIVAEYTSLLLNFLNTKGDAILNSHRNCLPKDVAERVWTQMLKMNRDTLGREPFYYYACEAKDHVQIIEQSFRMNPVPLDQEMWKMLNRYHLCRTPADELLHRFRFAKVVPVPENNFAAHMSRMLRSLLQSTQNVNAMELTFVDGEHLQIDAGFLVDNWRIHNKWLTYEGSHEHTFCEAFSTEEDELFSCDHAVLQLWDILLGQLISTGNYPRIASDAGWLKSMARGRLAQMPRSVRCLTTDKKGELLVTWKSVDSYQHRDKEIRVVLHVETCTEIHSQNFLVRLSDDQRQCGCPSQLSQSVSDGIIFLDLKLDQDYLPSVSRNIEGALIALPPGPIKPRTESLAVTPEILIMPDMNTDHLPMTAAGSPSGEGESAMNLRDNVNDVNHSDDYDLFSQTYLRSSSPSSSVPEAISDVTDYTNQVFSDPQPDNAACNSSASGQNVAQPPTRITVLSSADTFVLGSKIEHQSLDWGGSFPGSHDFYRAGNAPNEEVFILKPKVRPFNKNGKRLHDLEEEPRAVRSKSKQHDCEDAENNGGD